MPFELPPLPFLKNSLAPAISEETMEFHYEKHHRSYVTKLNELVAHTLFDSLSLEQVVLRANGKVLNNAAQAWNHSFFWRCLSPQASKPSRRLENLIDTKFGSINSFRDQFAQKAADLFGSGWVWLSIDVSGELALDALANGGNPLRNGKSPLLTLDVWEHAYYIDYRNDRPKFIEKVWDLINWHFVSDNLETSQPLARQVGKGEQFGKELR